VRNFETKGDANEEADSRLASTDSVIGREVIAVPYLGYFVRYVQSPLGFMVLIVVPALAVMVLEMRKIFVDIRAREAADV
jgi:signal peptidase